MASTVAALRESPFLRRSFIVEVLQDLVRTRSVNPGTSEKAMADVIVRWLQPTPAEVTLVEFAPGRPSVAAVLRGAADGPTIVLNGHMDTVPIDDASLWTTDPFGAEVRDGFLYGRGACDMKAGLAVQIAVAHCVGQLAPRLRGSLVLHFAAGEERGEPGTRSLLKAGFGGDYGITTEPTGLRVAAASRGAAYHVIQLRGRSTHASQAELAHNPIWQLQKVLDVLREYDKEVRSHKHSLLSGGSCTPTMIRAGVKENAIPDRCELTIDRRLLPGEDPDADRASLRERLEKLRSRDPNVDFELSTVFSVEASEVSADSRFVAHMLETVREVTGQATAVWGTPFGSDVANLVNDGGMEAVTFGPGDVFECHCPDERVSLRQIEDASITIAQVVVDILVGRGLQS